MEKEEIERRSAEDLNTAENIRSGLEHKLEAATDALGAAEARLTSLEAELNAAKKAQVSEQQPKAGKAATAAGRHAGGDSGSGYDEASSSAAKEGGGQGRAADCSVADTPGSDPVSQDGVRGQERRPQKSETVAAPAETGEGRAELGRPQEAVTTAIAAATQEIESSDDRLSVLEREASKEGERSQALPETPLDGAQRQVEQEERRNGLRMRYSRVPFAWSETCGGRPYNNLRYPCPTTVLAHARECLGSSLNIA